MTTTATLTAYQLAELLRKVDAHVGRHGGYDAIEGVRLDSDGRHLHAVATDRFTVAVSRQQLRNTDPAWALTISAQEWTDDVAALRAWLDSHPGQENVHLSPGTDGLTVTSNRGKLVLQASDRDFPDWRGLVRTALHHPPTESPFSGFQSRLLARWEQAGDRITTWQAAFDKPLVVHGHNFIGLQMPMRLHDDESPESRWDEWMGSVGAEGAPVVQDETLHHWEAAALDEKESYVDDVAADLLKQVLRSSTDVFGLATRDTGALAAYALAGGRAWMAYRLLKAMEKGAPDLLRQTLEDVDEQLESGEIGEWAWDEAALAGHDPQAWRDEYAAHLKELADKKAAATA